MLKARKSYILTTSSILHIPTALWELNSSVPHFWRDDARHSPISRLSPGADEGAKGGSAPLQAFPLQCNLLATQHFPTEGPPNAWIISLFLLCLWSIPSASCGKAQFLGKQQLFLKIGIPVKEADPDQALPLCPNLHPSLGNSPSWKCLGYKCSPKNSLWHFSLYYLNFPLAEIIPTKTTAEYKTGKAALCRRSSGDGSRQSTCRLSAAASAWIYLTWGFARP